MRELATQVSAEFAELVAMSSQLDRLLRHSLLMPKELACVLRRLVHELEDDEEMSGEDTHGIAPRDRKVYFHRGRLKLGAAYRFFARIDALPAECRAAVLSAWVSDGSGGTGPAAPDGGPLARGEQILLAEGYPEEIDALVADGTVGLPARERDVALLHHGDEHLTPEAIVARLGCTLEEVNADLRRMHGRIHAVRLARFRAADAEARRGLLKERFIGDLGRLDAAHRRVAIQICVRWPLVADAARFFDTTIPKVTRALAEAQGIGEEG